VQDLQQELPVMARAREVQAPRGAISVEGRAWLTNVPTRTTILVGSPIRKERTHGMPRFAGAIPAATDLVRQSRSNGRCTRYPFLRETAMPCFDLGLRNSSFGRTFVFGLVASVISVGAAFAQTSTFPHVRVIDDSIEIRTFQRGGSRAVTTVAAGTLLEVLYTDGDRYRHQDDNWYLVLLGPDPWGIRRPGWIRGRNVELIPASRPVRPALQTGRVEAPPIVAPPAPPPAAARPAEAIPVAAAVRPASPPVPAQPAVSEVVLYFDFGKSQLTEAAKGQLEAAASSFKVAEAVVAIALEGHADRIGTEAFNERLGVARAETVKQFISDRFKIPAGKISVVSYGEGKPAASNDTEAGRALNRRVLIKIGA
jgi:OOP family OmpA-OmpF porin